MKVSAVGFRNLSGSLDVSWRLSGVFRTIVRTECICEYVLYCDSGVTVNQVRSVSARERSAMCESLKCNLNY